MAKDKKKLDELETKEDSVLEALIASISKKHGRGSVMPLADFKVDVETFSTRSLFLDKALGIGGIPRGRITEVYGPESSGKSTLAINMIASAQKSGHRALIVDAEHALDRAWASKLGVDLHNVYISQPDSAEEGLDVVEDFVRSGTVGIVVVDSVAALVPQAEIDGEMGDQQIGLQARLLSKAMRKLAGPVSESNTSLVFINQLRSKISGFGFGPQETTSGGNALKYYASIRIELKKIKTTKDFAIIRAKVTKNKLAPPFCVCEIPLFYDCGFSMIDEVIDEGIRIGEIIKSGSWFSIGANRIGQGRDQVKAYLKGNQAESERLTELVAQSLVIDDVNIGSDDE